MKIAITTPSGHVGSKVVEKLQALGGFDLVLPVRCPEHLTEAQSHGATVIQGSLEDSDCLMRATQGVDSLFWVLPIDIQNTDLCAFDTILAQTAAQVIRSNGIHHTVFLSSIGAHLEEGTGPVTGLHDAEQILRMVCPSLTFIRAGYFMENYFRMLDSILQRQVIELPVSGEALFFMVATQDIGEVAARCLIDENPRALHTLTLHSAGFYTFNQAAQIISDALGMTVRHVTITPEQARRDWLNMGASPDVANLYVEMYEAMDRGDMVPEFPISQHTITPTSFERFCRTHLKAEARKHAHV